MNIVSFSRCPTCGKYKRSDQGRLLRCCGELIEFARLRIAVEAVSKHIMDTYVKAFSKIEELLDDSV